MEAAEVIGEAVADGVVAAGVEGVVAAGFGGGAEVEAELL